MESFSLPRKGVSRVFHFFAMVFQNLRGVSFVLLYLSLYMFSVEIKYKDPKTDVSSVFSRSFLESDEKLAVTEEWHFAQIQC